MRVTTIALAAALSAVTTMRPAAGQDVTLPLHVTAWAVNMSNIATGANRTVQINVDRWSTDAERDELLKTFAEKGPDKLLDALQDTKRVGFIKLPNTLGYDLHFARLRPQDDGGSQIVLITDRYIGTQEAIRNPRVSDYPFTLIEIRVKPDGTGEGKMSLATKIEFNRDKQMVELENYASEPVRLQNVKIESKK